MIIRWHVNTGYREYQRTPGVSSRIKGAAERVAEEAGGSEAGFEVDFQPESGRRRTPRASVRTATFAARESEARHRTLTKAIDAARGEGD